MEFEARILGTSGGSGGAPFVRPPCPSNAYQGSFPIVVFPLEDINVVEGDHTTLEVIDLRYVFFHVDVPFPGGGTSPPPSGGSTNPLVNAAVAGTHLALTFTGGQTGAAAVEAKAIDDFAQTASSSAGIQVVPVDETSSVLELDVLNDNGEIGNDNITTDTRVIGRVKGDLLRREIRVEFDLWSNAANLPNPADLYATALDDGTFVLDLGNFTGTGVGHYGSFPTGGYWPGGFQYRATTYDQGVRTYEGPWHSEYSFQFPPSVGVTSVDASSLTVDPGTVGGLVMGSIWSGFGGGVVEYDLDGDLHADGSAAVNSSGDFQFAIPNPIYGEHFVNLRAGTPSFVNPNYLDYGGWNPVSFIIDGAPAPINSLTFTPASSGSPSVSAKLTGAIDTTHRAGDQKTVVQFDFDSDGESDGSTVTAAGGTFTYDALGLAYGTVTVQARTYRWNELARDDVYSEWFSITVSHDLEIPSIASLGVTNVPDPTSGSTAPTIGGQLSGADLSGTRIEFDHNSDGHSDAATTAAGGGTFAYTAYGLPSGSTTINARVGRPDIDGTFVYGAWSEFTVSGNPTNGGIPGSARLYRDTGKVGDFVTSDPTISGTLAIPSQVTYFVMQFDHDGDGSPDGEAAPKSWPSITDVTSRYDFYDPESGYENGYEPGEDDYTGGISGGGTAYPNWDGAYRYVPVGLAHGPQTIYARSEGWDYENQRPAYSAWQAISFTYAPDVNAAPTISEFDLVTSGGVTPDPDPAPGITKSIYSLLEGTVVDDNAAGNLTIEFDHDGDGVPEGLTFTAADGSFRYQPAALIYGSQSIRARALQWDYATGAYLVGDWVETTFVYLPAPNVPAIITSVRVDDGSPSTPPESANEGSSTSAASTPTIVGQINNEWWLDDIWIEFNLKDDSNPTDYSLMAITQTDADGQFSFTPSGLPGGSATIRLRTKEFDNGTISFLYGPWTELSYYNPSPSATTVTITQAPATVNASINAFSLSVASGATSNATLTGIVSTGGVALTGVTVTVSGGGSSGSVVTDSTGTFTHTLTNIPEGFTTAVATVSGGLGSLPDGTSILPPSSITTFNFVYATDPSDPAVQELVTDLSLTDSNWQTAGGRGASGGMYGGGLGDAARTAAQQVYEDALALATQARNGAVKTATQGYGAVARQADAAYAAAVTAAHATFLTDMAAYSGDKTTYPTAEFSTPNAPPDDAMHIPDDRNQPRPPTAPSYSGPAYDFAADKVYQSAIHAAQSARDQAMGKANANFTKAEQAANSAYNAAAQAADAKHGAALSSAYAQYNAALATPHPTIDLAAEETYYQRVLGDAGQRYHDMVTRNNEAFDQARDAAQAELDRVFAAIDAADQARQEALDAPGIPDRTRQAGLAGATLWYAYHAADVLLEFRQTIEKLENRRDKQNADALQIYEQSVPRTHHEFRTLRSRYHHFFEERKIIAAQRLVQARAHADKIKARDLAAATYARSEALAVAENARTIAITQANANSWKEEARAKKSALDRWSTGNPGYWHDYQAQLAAHELAYVEQMADKRVEYSTAVANATLKETRAIAAAVRSHANKDAQLVYDRIKKQSAAVRDKALDENDNDFDIEGRDIFDPSRTSVLRSNKYSLAGLEAAYTKKVADAQLVHDLALAGANHAVSYAAADAASARILNDWQGSHAIDSIGINAAHDFSATAESARVTLEREKLTLEKDHLDEIYRHQESLGRGQLYVTESFKLQNADLISEYETKVGEANRDYTIDSATIAATRDSAIATATRQWWDSSSSADATYVVAEAGIARDRVIDDAESLLNFQASTAMRYAVEVAAWGGGTTNIPFLCPSGYACNWVLDSAAPIRPSDPWKAYQLDLASAEYFRVVGVGRASVDYVTTVANRQVTHTQTIAVADSAFASAQAAAYEKQVKDMEQPLILHATTVGDSSLSHAIGVGAAMRTHDRDVITSNAAHEVAQTDLDADAQRQIAFSRWETHKYENEQRHIRSGIVNGATRTRNLAHNAAWWDYQDGVINGTQYQARLVQANADFDAVVIPALNNYDNLMAARRALELSQIASIKWGASVDSAYWHEANVNQVAGKDIALAAAIYGFDDSLSVSIETAAVTLAQSRKNAVKDGVRDVAVARETLRNEIAGADRDLAKAVAGADATLAADLDRAGSTFREASVAARGVYEVALFDGHEQDMAAAASGPLAVGKTLSVLLHRSKVAQLDAAHSLNVTTELNTYHGDLTSAYAALLITMNGADTGYVDGVENAGYSHAATLATGAKTRSISLSNAEADRNFAAEAADAALGRGYAKTESAYTRDVVNSDAAHRIALSAVNTAWVIAAATAEYRWEVNPEDPLRDKVRDHDYAVAHADASVLSAAKETARIHAVGGAQDTRAAALGVIGKTHADKLATAGTDYVSATSSADLAYINTSATSDNTLVSTVANGDTAYANASESANRTLTGSLGNANVKLVRETGISTVAQASAISESEAHYHVTGANDDYQRWYALTWHTPTQEIPYETEYLRAKSFAERDWMFSFVANFKAYVTGNVQADVDRSNGVAEASRARANAGADANVTFVGASAPLSAALKTSTAGTINNYTVGTVARDNTRLTQLANTLGSLTREEADAEKTRAVAVAVAEHAWQDAKAQAAEVYTTAQAQASKAHAAAVLSAESDLHYNGNYASYETAIATADANFTAAVLAAASTRFSTEQAAELVYKKAVGDADLALATAKSASRKNWTDATVNAEKQFVIDESNAIKLRRNAIAGHELTYATSLAPVAGDRDVNYANALTGFWDAEQAADNAWLMSVSNAQADYWDTDYLKSAGLGLGLSLPWAGAMDTLGGTIEHVWQSYARNQYLNLASHINSANTAYQGTLTSEYGTLANSMRTADITRANALAGAEYTHATSFANLEANFFITMAGLSNTYVKDSEAAAHANRVAEATAERHLFVGIDSGGSPFGQTEFGAALAAASNSLSTARQAIERTYDRGDVTTFGAFNIALAKNTHGYFTASTAANLTHTTTESALDRAYSIQEANANHLRETTVAVADESYRRFESSQLRYVSGGSLSSPWLILNQGLLEASDDFRQAESTAAQALRIAAADADKQLETDAALALETLTNTLAQIGKDEVMAAADDALNEAIDQAIAETLDFHAGRTNPANPEIPRRPQVYSHAIDAVIEEDYARDGLYYYGGPMHWSWYDGDEVHELRFFGLQPTNRSQLPDSFPELRQVSRDLERGLAERREFASYDLTMEGYYYADDTLSSFEAIGRLGDYYHEFVRTSIEVPLGGVEGLGANVAYSFTQVGQAVDNVLVLKSAILNSQFQTHFMVSSDYELPSGSHVKVILTAPLQYRGAAEFRLPHLYAHPNEGSLSSTMGDKTETTFDESTGTFTFSVVPDVGEWVEGQPLDKETILLAFRLVYGEIGQRLLEIYERAGGIIEVTNVLGDWDVDLGWLSFGGPFGIGGKQHFDIRIQIEKDVTPVQAANLLWKALSERAIGTWVVRQHISGKEWIELDRRIKQAQIQSAASAVLNGIYAIEIAITIPLEPLDWGIAIAEIGNGNYAAAIGFLPLAPAGAAAVLRQTKAGELVIDVVKKSDVLTDAVMHHFDKHHAWFRILGGSDEAHNLVKMHAHLHHGSKVGVHQHILAELHLNTIQELHGLWTLAMVAAKNGNNAAIKNLAQSILDAYRSYFRDSVDYERIILIFKNALELETGFKLR